jgi:hypothetical protein
MKTRILNTPIKGHLNDVVMEKIFRKFLRHIGSGDFYIGKTGRNPEERLKDHKKNNVECSKMIILYSSMSKKYVEAVERNLVFWSYDYNSNRTGGGGGSLSKRDKFNYVYLLVK